MPNCQPEISVMPYESGFYLSSWVDERTLRWLAKYCLGFVCNPISRKDWHLSQCPREDAPSHGVSEQCPDWTEQSRETWFLSSLEQGPFCIHTWTSELQVFRFSRLGWELAIRFPRLASLYTPCTREIFFLYPKSFALPLLWGEQLSPEFPRKRKKALETSPSLHYCPSTAASHWCPIRHRTPGGQQFP